MGRKIEQAKKRTFHVGEHFSAHVHGMFLHPHATIKKIVREGVIPKDTIVPALAVICAAVATAIGAGLWGLIAEESLILSFFRTLTFFGDVVIRPIIYLLLYWPITTGVFHFIGSIVSGKDIGNSHIAHRTLKLVGFSMVPLFLNVLPKFYLVTGFWFWLLSLWAIEENYDLTWKGALVVTLPLLFVTVLKTLYFLNII